MSDLDDLDDMFGEPSKPITTKTTTAAQKHANKAVSRAINDDLDDSNDLFNMDSMIGNAKSVKPATGAAGGFSYSGGGLNKQNASSGLSSANNAVSRSRVTGLGAGGDDSDFGISRKPSYGAAGMSYARNDTFAAGGAGGS